MINVNQRVLAVGAHPDDIEFGCLGTLLKLPLDTKKCIYVASMGSAGDPSSSAQRCAESRNGLSCLKNTELHFREKAGIAHNEFQPVMDELYLLIQKFNPDLILTMSPQDTHQEHRAVYDITISAARRSKASILCYGILSNTPEFRPNYFVDVGEVYAQKVKALREHKSQSHKYYMTDEYLDIFHGHNYAALHGIPKCEAFEVVRLFS
jgi:LmbE family N-acetylglucosaminyl deacetylase